MRLGEMLIQRGLLTQEELEQALELQKERGEKLGRILVDLALSRIARCSQRSPSN
jgi:hypothetical protein